MIRNFKAHFSNTNRTFGAAPNVKCTPSHPSSHLPACDQGHVHMNPGLGESAKRLGWIDGPVHMKWLRNDHMWNLLPGCESSADIQLIVDFTPTSVAPLP
ncbi:hypothetical protein ILYODFUR_030141 [Ilyodon furcidens]|uniref:Uncharacterized protein n=1 Tax=Ilyodon furcidens TaxID=33524 RepID=A0ABV0U9P2_9TELE